MELLIVFIIGIGIVLLVSSVQDGVRRLREMDEKRRRHGGLK